MGQQAIDSLTGAELGNEQREARFRRILNRSFDMATIARFTLGRYWRVATEEQRAEYVCRFEDFVVRAYAARFTEYSGESFKVGQVRDASQIKLRSLRRNRCTTRIETMNKETLAHDSIGPLVLSWFGRTGPPVSDFGSPGFGGFKPSRGAMRGLKCALALAATTAFVPTTFLPTVFAPMAVKAEPLSVAADKAGIFRIIELKGSAVKWGSPTMETGATITYAFATETVEFFEARNCRGIEPMDELLARSGVDQAVYEAEAAKAFDAWSAVANVQFRQVSDADEADILIGAQTSPIGRAFTNVSFARADASAVRPLEKSLICLNPDQLWKVGFDGNLDVYDLRYTLKHEIGHAIGLDHPSTNTQVMSYRYEERFETLQPGDIRGAVALYGNPHRLMVETLDVSQASPLPEASRDHQYRALSPVRD